jgi:hypothetical protein
MKTSDIAGKANTNCEFEQYTIFGHEQARLNMKKTTILISLLIIVLTGYGQRAGNTLISLGVGANIPTGDYASIDLENENAGFALTGVNLNVTALYKLGRRIGVGGEFSGSSNWVNNAGYQSAFEQAFPDLENWQVNAQRWSNGGIMAGPAATLPLGNTLDFLFKVFGGGVLAYTPMVEVIGEINNQQQYIRLYEQNKAWAFTFKVGAGLMFSTGSRQYLMFTGEYQYINPTFTGFRVLVYEDPDEPPVITDVSRTLPMNAFNVTIGYGYYL